MSDPKIQRLLKLLEVERDTRQAQTKSALGYHIVTRTREITPYMQAAFVALNEAGKADIISISDVAAPDFNGPFCLWLKEVATYLAQRGAGEQLHEIDPSGLPSELAAQWTSWAPRHVLWSPLKKANGQVIGAVWLTREEPWPENDQVLIERLSDCYAHAWFALTQGFKVLGKVNKKILAGVCAAVLALGVVPVRQSALAPAEIVPKDPFVVSAPLEGVISDVLVKPYMAVEEGQELFRFDETTLRNKVAIAQEALEVTRVELQTARQSAFHDLDSQAKLAFLEAQVGLREAELTYTRNMLERSVIRAPYSGVVVFRDVNDWIGRPVKTGEKILLLAKPDQTQLRINLPVSDAINLEVGADVRLFLDVDPLASYEAELVRTSYEPQLSQTGQELTFPVIAAFKQTEQSPRIGLRGTAKLYGDQTVLGLYIFRKPLAAARKWLGW